MPDKKDLLVSIIMPNYNCAQYIGRAIESVRAQTYPHWELIIVDDSSTDDSVKEVRPYLRDRRIKLKSNVQNSGAAVARNAAIRVSKGRYIAFLDSDDQWYPQKLEKQIAFMRKHKLPISYCLTDIVDEDGKYISTLKTKKALSYHDLLKHYRIPIIAAIVDTKYLGRRYYPEQSAYVEDYIYWLSLLKEGHLASVLEESLAAYTIRKQSTSSNKLRMAPRVWKVLRHHENLPLLRALVCFADYAIHGFIAKHERRHINK